MKTNFLHSVLPVSDAWINVKLIKFHANLHLRNGFKRLILANDLLLLTVAGTDTNKLSCKSFLYQI